MDIYEVLEYLPQRYPILMIDKVKECEPGKRIVAIKNVSANEPQFLGHFPGRPIMPGVLILEAMAQAAGVMVFSAMDRPQMEHSLYYYVGIDKARFKKPVMPGDTLELNVEIKRFARGIWWFATRAKVDGQVVTEADLMCTLRTIDSPTA